MIEEFVIKYYSEDGETADYYIIGVTGDLCHDIVCIHDDIFWWISNIWEALHHNIPVDTVHEWYNYQDQLNYDSNWEKNPTNLVSFRKWAPKIEMTEEEKAESRREIIKLAKILDEECEKNKSEEYKAKQEQWKKDTINVWNEYEWDMYCTVYTAKQAIKQYHIERWEFF